MPRDIITFQCTECKNRNYSSTKNKKTTTERLEMKKLVAADLFCGACGVRGASCTSVSLIRYLSLNPLGLEGEKSDQRSLLCPEPTAAAAVP